MKAVAWISAAVCMATGLAGLLAPDSLADIDHLDVTSAAGRGEIRAVYFAWTGYGIALLLAFRRRKTEGLRALATVLACMVVARVFSLFLDGYHGYTVVAILVEGALAAICLGNVSVVRQSRA
ncbi:MAG: DUF4345 domain-containing protein [Planctomycetota bacterium]|jgi:hypothetical protein